MIRAGLILAGIVLAMWVEVCAQTPPPTPTNADESVSGSISGKVVNEQGQPLAGATLYIRSLRATANRTMVSDLEGNFQVNSLDAGLYIITATAPAYTTEPTTTPTYYRLGDSARVELVRGGVITGTVTNAIGEPMIGVRVRVTKIRDAKGEQPKQLTYAYGERQTDDRGVYRIYGLTSGTYVVSAGGGSNFASVFNPYDQDIPTYSPSGTRDTAAEISVRSGEESVADIRYRGEPGYSISGKVVSATGSATITITPVGSLWATNTFQPPSASGFLINGLSDGEYKLGAQAVVASPGSTTSQFMMSDIKRVTIKGASVTGVELVPQPVASLKGVVLLESTKLPECQGKRAPLFDEMLVQVRRNEKDTQDDDPFYARMTASSAAPDPKGEFLLRNLRPGRYSFDTRFYARYWFLQSIAINTTAPRPQKFDAAANWTVVKSGEQLTNVTITLAAGAASIRGKVSATEGTPFPARVYLVPSEPTKAEAVLRFFVGEISADGAFALNNVPPGKYFILTQNNVDARTGTLTKLREPDAAAARTKLRRTAETQKTEIELKPCQNLADYQLKQ